MEPIGTLLFVDDDTIMLKNCRQLFNKSQHTLHVAVSGEQALEIISNDIIDVLVADYLLPGINGIRLIERALKIQPYIQSIVFTAYGDLESAKKAMELGVRAYIEKKGELQAKGGGGVVFLPKDMQTDMLTLHQHVDRLIAGGVRYQVVSTMNLALWLWEIQMRRDKHNYSRYEYKATFAEASGLWKVQQEGHIRRTRGLDRYLDTSKLPARPRKDLVMRSIRFILDHCQSVENEHWHDLKMRSEKIERRFSFQ